MEYIKEFFNLFSPIKKTLKCNCAKKNQDYCESIAKFLKLTKTNKNFDNDTAKKLYEGLLSVDSKSLGIEEENLKQILKDLSRTYPDNQMFKVAENKDKMLNVLKAFSNYDREIRYVQGMNFIVGFFLYHCEEHVAFWLFVSLIEEYQLREIFLQGLPGLSIHSKNLEKILKSEFPSEYGILDKINVNIEICMVEWVFSLFSSLIPLEIQLNFYEGFFIGGWTFFYKVCISILLSIDLTNKSYIDPEDVYIALKLGKSNHDVNKDQIIKKWNKVIDKAYNIDINTENL